MNVEELTAKYHDLVVTACEWRAMGLADPHTMAAAAFDALDEHRDHGLRDLYRAIDKVVQKAYQDYSDQISIMDRLRGGAVIGRRAPHNPADDFLRALSNLRGRDRELLQLRFWDDLDETEAAEVLGTDIEHIRQHLAKAGTRYLSKLSRSHPDLALSDIVDTLSSIKPGIYRRYGSAGL